MPDTRPFTHLNVHSEFSLLRAASRIDDIVSTCVEQEMSGCALTDSGNMFAILPFMRKAQAAGVQPILGMQVYLAGKGRLDRGREAKRTSELVLLATSTVGWHNLLELATIGYLEGFYYTPRIDREVLAKHHEGLIVLSGALKGAVGDLLAYDEDERAADVAREFEDIVGKGNFYLELQDHGLPQETKVNEKSIVLSRDLGIPCVATNNVHYTRREDHIVHDVLLCIGQGKLRSDEKRQRFYGDQYFLKSPREMNELFGHWPECLDATEVIRERCQVKLDLEGMHIPNFAPPSGLDPEQYLRKLCEEGVQERYGSGEADGLPPAPRDRLEMELGVISRMGFTNYFLIVWDFIKHSREIDVPVGPGRGSAAGSIVAFSLGITGIDPLKYDLLFERFLNEGRMEMPDIDIDFETDGRARVIEYVTEKYGRENVAQIITFGTMAARGALRDVARVLDVPLGTVDAIAKKVPMNTSLSEALKLEADLREMIDSDESVAELFDIAQKMEGLSRQAGTHAAGVIIADAPIQNYCPLFKNGDDIATQFDMRIVESVGLLKMDFLGLSTLTLIQRALELIKASTGDVVDADNLPLDDAKSYRLLSRGEAKGVFQFESDGMRQLLSKLKPDRFEDLIALVALYRPGPLQSGMVDKYIDVKHGRDQPVYLHPELEPILEETYGVILYQEQVMKIASDLAGFTLQEADALRKAMGKKKQSLMDAFALQFREQSGKRGHDEDIATEIFDQMAFFAGYGFNKSHSAAYALVAYQTAWLKANYPTQFMAALLTVESQNTDKVVGYIEECKRMNIRLLGPDINRSHAHFTVEEFEGTPAIRFGLGAVKGVGFKAVDSMVAEKGDGEFTSLYDFCETVDLRLVNRAVCEALVKSGAFDAVTSNRAALLAGCDKALSAGARAQADRKRGQGDLFGGSSSAPAAAPGLPDVPEWSDRERLAYEKEAIGFYLSGHPLSEYEHQIRDFATSNSSTLGDLADGEEVLLGGMVVGVQVRIIQKEGRNQGKKMAKFTFEDLQGSVGGVCFPRQFEEYHELLQNDRILFLKGKVSDRNAEPEVMVDELLSVEDAAQKLARSVIVAVDEGASGDERTWSGISGVCRSHAGNVPVIIELLSSSGSRVTLRAGDDLSVLPTPLLVEGLSAIVGKQNVVLSAR